MAYGGVCWVAIWIRTACVFSVVKSRRMACVVSSYDPVSYGALSAVTENRPSFSNVQVSLGISAMCHVPAIVFVFAPHAQQRSVSATSPNSLRNRYISNAAAFARRLSECRAETVHTDTIGI